MSDFKAKMHQIRFPLWLRPRPRWSTLQPVFKGPTSKGMEGEGWGEGERKRRERGKERVREKNGGESWPQLGSLDPPVFAIACGSPVFN